MIKNQTDTKSNIPSEEQIEHLLMNLKPRPGQRFYKKMEAQPWNQEGIGMLWKWVQHRGLPATLTLIVILVILISFASPSLEVLANRISRFFALSSGDQITIQIPSEELGNPSTSFSMDIREVEALAGYAVKVPGMLPTGYHLTGARFSPNRQTVTLNFSTETGDQILRFSQRPVGVEYQGISANAHVEHVQIGSLAGEYVFGGWRITETQIVPTTPEDHQKASWETDTSIQYLIWQEGEMVFEIFFSGGEPGDAGFLEKFDLISMAETIQ